VRDREYECESFQTDEGNSFASGGYANKQADDGYKKNALSEMHKDSPGWFLE